MQKKKLYIGTNTKMYKTIAQTLPFLSRLGSLTSDIDRNRCEIFVIPSYTSLESVKSIAKGGKITLGAQNMCWEDEGQFTGEISPLMLKEVGAEIVELGHSERRHVLHEDDIMINKKIHAALRHEFTPLLCVGEKEEQKRYKINKEIIRMQLKIGLWNVTPQQARHIWIAYEPVWAIGENGKPATKEYADEIHGVIKETLVELFGKEIGTAIPILYGGSVNAENACELIKMPNIDGLFIGRSAWNADNFSRIIHHVLNAYT